MKLLVCIFIIFFLFLGGCVSPNNSTTPQMHVCPSGDTVSNPSLCLGVGNQSNSVQADSKKSTCPYDCCDSAQYDFKGCSNGKECSNNTCVQKNCPYECCDGTNYLKKDCSFNQECLNNQCVTAQCPYECCTGANYARKDCSAGYQCINDKCDLIPKPQIALTIDECVTSQNVRQMLGEVTDVYVTAENYGTKEAINLEIASTANDAEQVISIAHGRVTALPAKSVKKVKLTVDTDSDIPTTVTVTAFCNECAPQTLTSTNSDCHYNIKKIIDTVNEYAPVVAGLI